MIFRNHDFHVLNVVSSIWGHAHQIPEVFKFKNDVVNLNFHDDFDVFW